MNLKKGFIFKLTIFVQKLSNFIRFQSSFLLNFISDPELSGSGMNFSDPSGSTVLFPVTEL
jgi:hypothetical protein